MALVAKKPLPKPKGKRKPKLDEPVRQCYSITRYHKRIVEDLSANLGLPMSSIVRAAIVLARGASRGLLLDTVRNEKNIIPVTVRTR